MVKTVYNGLATSDRKTSAGWLNFWKERKGYAGNRRRKMAGTSRSAKTIGLARFISSRFAGNVTESRAMKRLR